MSRPGDHIAADAAGHGRLGVSPAGREQAIEVLKTAFVQGRLTKDDFGTRIDHAFTSQTCAELTAVTADLPAGLMAVPPSRQIARARPRRSMNTALSAGAFATIATLVGMMAAVASRSAIAVISVSVITALLVVLAFGALMVLSWRGRAR
jgi:hypothetical protein